MSEDAFPEYQWMATAGVIFGALYAFGIGANDVANSFGSSVSAKSLTLLQAIMVASVMELSGALLLGASVTGTIRGKILVSSYWTAEPQLLMLGMLCSLMLGSFWLLTATALQFPVSTTHTIVASIVGFGYAAYGWDTINWPELKKIFISWVGSPCLTGAFGFAFFILVKHLVLRAQDPFSRSIGAYPVIVFTGITVDVWLVLKKAYGNVKKIDDKWIRTVSVPAALGAGLGCALITYFIICPILKRKILREERERLEWEEAEKQAAEEAELKKAEGGDEAAAEEEAVPEDEDEMPWVLKAWNNFVNSTFRQDLQTQSFSESNRAEKLWDREENYDAKSEALFKYVQVFTACLTSFAHGANDVANAIAPVSAILTIQETGAIPKNSDVKYWTLAMGGACLGVGFIFFGYRIIKAVGYKITKITPSRGACLELATALAVAVASYLGIPVSTTQCLVGATAGVALASGGFRAVEWFFLLRIMVGWAGVFFIAAVTNGLFFYMCAYSPSITE